MTDHTYKAPEAFNTLLIERDEKRGVVTWRITTPSAEMSGEAPTDVAAFDAVNRAILLMARQEATHRFDGKRNVPSRATGDTK